jgi:replicative DNA helicase
MENNKTTTITPTTKWRNRKDNYLEALHYLDGRRKGVITSIKTPWGRFNDAGINGIEWNSVIVIGARPGGFKTTIKDAIINKAFDLNPNEKFRVLDFQLEMLGRVTAIREFSSAVGLSYKDLCSADSPLNKIMLQKCLDYANEKSKVSKYPVDIVDKSMTVDAFALTVEEYMEAHRDPETGEYTKTIIGLDHTRLLLNASFQTEEQKIFHLSIVVTELKRRYPIIFIILSQLNRGCEQPQRLEEGKATNYLIGPDLFGSDSMEQCADIIVLINRPMKYHIRHYGPNRFVIEDDSIIAAHFTKVRNGDPRLSFFKAIPARMSIIEIEPPHSALNRSKLPNMHTDVVRKTDEAAAIPQSDLQPNNLFTQEGEKKVEQASDIIKATPGEHEEDLPF